MILNCGIITDNNQIIINHFIFQTAIILCKQPSHLRTRISLVSKTCFKHFFIFLTLYMNQPFMNVLKFQISSLYIKSKIISLSKCQKNLFENHKKLQNMKHIKYCTLKVDFILICKMQVMAFIRLELVQSSVDKTNNN